MKTWKTFWFLGIGALGLLAVAGCESDPAAPQETYNVDSATAEEWSLQAVDMINQMAAAVPMASQGNFTTLLADKSAAEPVWDPEQMAWVYNATESFTIGDPPTTTGESRMELWIQFRNVEGPLPAPEYATEMEYYQSAGMTMHTDDEQGVSDLDFDLSCGMVVTYLETGFDMTGTGEAEVTASSTTEGRTENVNLTMSWGLDLVTLFEGCPTGTAFVQVGPYRTDVVYDGQGNAAWTLVGPNYSGSGTELISCAEGM
jgi:hypothetical protein